MNPKIQSIINDVDVYYSDKLAQHGDTPQGVDWNGEYSQNLRFQQLLKIINPGDRNFSINDLGCGYGALLDSLKTQYPSANYLGIDISTKMISKAVNRYCNLGILGF